MRRVDYLFLAMIAFAAAVASAPPPPRISIVAGADAWTVDDIDRVAVTQLEPAGNNQPP